MPGAQGTLGALCHRTGRPYGSDGKVSPEPSSWKYRSAHPPIGAESSHMAGLLTDVWCDQLMVRLRPEQARAGQALEQWFSNAVGHIASW